MLPYDPSPTTPLVAGIDYILVDEYSTRERQPHAHRPEDLSALPRVSGDDIRATLMAIAVVIVIGFLCSLDGIA